MKTLRKPESEKIYQDHLKTKSETCPFCIDGAETWRIQPAKFPYDAVYSQHDILFPSRHISSIDELTMKEQAELKGLFDEFDRNNIYSSIMYNFKATQSVQGHLHFHLIKL